jgi:hypothetical protein
MDTMHSEAGGVIHRIPKELGEADSEDLRTILQLHLIQQVRTKYFK